jgi:mono/diheme cytochrome c family protein
LRFKLAHGGPFSLGERVLLSQRPWDAGPVLKPNSISTLSVIVALIAFSGTAGAANSLGDSGHAVFMQNGCFVCHGELGYGGAGPGFRDDKMLAVDDYVVGRILFGGGIMPPFGGKLSDAEIASVATYIRNSWGNRFGPISPEKVAQARQALTNTNAQNKPQTEGATQ